MKPVFAVAALIIAQAYMPPAFAMQAQAPTAQADIDQAELQAASIPIENYIKALATGSADTARLAFHPNAHLVGVNRTGYYSTPIEEWMKNFTGAPSAEEAQRKRSFTIIDLTPTTGVAKVVVVNPTVTFIDHMALLNIGDEWKIVQKLSRAIQPPVIAN